MPAAPLACRVASYRPFEPLAYEHLASLGVRYVELRAPVLDQLDETQAALRRFGLQACTLQGPCDLKRPDVAAQLEAQMPVFAALGARCMLLSVRADETPLPLVYERLRAAGDVAARHGVTLIAETHPDLFTNAEIALRTLQAVDHPQVRLNFDTANIYFYNQGLDAVEELRRCLPYVAGLHLKDTAGGFQQWNFPALGRGGVDFRGIFALLEATKFNGPCTIEIQGIEGETPTPELICGRVAESVAFLQRLKARV